jgi:hypothetical protein
MMILNNKIAHEWMEEYVSKIQALKTADSNDILLILDKASQYKFRLIEVLGETEFNKQLQEYTSKYNRIKYNIDCKKN